MRTFANAFLFLVFSAPALAQETMPLPSSIDVLAEDFLKDKEYACLSLGIVTTDAEHVAHFGRIDGDKIPSEPTDKTLYEIGSITKTFTGTLLSIAVQRNEVAETDAANQHLPDSLQIRGKRAKDVQLIHLATHRSRLPVQPPGIGLLGMMKGTPDNPYLHYDESNLAITMEQQVRVVTKVGKKYQYSNLGVGLLGHALVAAAEAESYESLVRARILDPLDMDSHIALDDTDKARKAVGHKTSGKATNGWDLASLEGCGALRCSVSDMIKYARANLGEGDEALCNAMKEAHRLRTDDDQTPMGLCWHILDVADTEVLFHNGGTGGFRSFMTVVPEKKLAVVILHNSDHSVDAMGIEITKKLLKAE